MKPTIFVDMDEVIADLSEAIRLTVNEENFTDFPIGFNTEYWWQSYGASKSYFERLLNTKGLFLNLQPVVGARLYLHSLYKRGYDIHILTLPQHNEFCFNEKIEWIKKYFSFINIDTNFHTSGNKGLFAKKGWILIDDNLTHLNSWRENGGIAMAFSHPWNKGFDGKRFDKWKEIHDYILDNIITEDNIDKVYDEDIKSIDVDIFKKYMNGSHNE